jgi:hypothetical protein
MLDLLLQVPATGRPRCKQAACTAFPRKAGYCTRHMRIHGIQPTEHTCAAGGCGKQTQSAKSGERLYCKIHMRERGLSPRRKECAVEGCRVEASAGARDAKRTYCTRHMRERGLEPAKKSRA